MRFLDKNRLISYNQFKYIIRGEIMSKRLSYLDVLKFIGILFIYVGHYTTSTNLLHPFVFEFHVPLFFVLSGFTETLAKDTTLLNGIYKKFKNILVPFFVFAFASVAVHVLIYAHDTASAIETVKEAIPQILTGCIRNQFLASSLWFLSCLFVVGVFFQFLKRLRHPIIILAVSLAVFLLNAYAPFDIPPYYNLHYAAYYQLYYAIGYAVFPAINGLLSSEKPVLRTVKWVSGVWATVFTALLFFKKNVYRIPLSHKLVDLFVPVATALTAIWFFLLVSYLLQDCTLLSDLGQSTLYFCGSEFMIKRIANTVVGAFVAINIHNAAIALSVSFALLLFAQKFVVPIEKKVFGEINRRIDAIFHKVNKKNQ